LQNREGVAWFGAATQLIVRPLIDQAKSGNRISNDVLPKGTHWNILPIVIYDWNEEKNKQLKKHRSISFEEIVLCIQEGKLVTILENPNQKKYPNQQLYLIDYRKQIYVVPFVNNKEEGVIFLKTIFPSRHYTRNYLEWKQ
jgi:uncharacterized DUF497 family protein